MQNFERKFGDFIQIIFTKPRKKSNKMRQTLSPIFGSFYATSTPSSRASPEGSFLSVIPISSSELRERNKRLSLIRYGWRQFFSEMNINIFSI